MRGPATKTENLVRAAERLAKAKKEIAKAAAFAAAGGFDGTDPRFEEAQRLVHALGYQIVQAAEEAEKAAVRA